jgi:hypothetical protein
LQQWNFNIERELMPGMALEVAYAGSKGTHLLGGPYLDQLPDQDLALGTGVLQNQVKNPFYGLIPFGSLAALLSPTGNCFVPILNTRV